MRLRFETHFFRQVYFVRPTRTTILSDDLQPPVKTVTRPGRVYLIGAGPGDPELLTLRAAERLSRCDVVLYDGLSNPSMLSHAPGAETINVGKHGQSRIWKQTEIVEEMIRHAVAGRTVGRLKGGDPAVFARTAEEVDGCIAAGIEFEIVPGITAALAAGSFAGIPVTHRGIASAVALVTGHEEPGKSQSALDWDALAKFPGTLVVYMGVTTAAAWTSALIGGGKDPATPAAILRRCTLHDQQQIHCRLDEVASHLTPASKFRPPVITIVGPVTELAHTMHWLRRRPLFGQTLLVTRPADDLDSLSQRLRDAGARVIEQPAIEIRKLDNYDALDDSIERLGSFDAVLFCSVNGVDHFINRMRVNGRDSRSFGDCKIGCVGSKTAAELSRFGLLADLVPTEFSGHGFVEEFGRSLTGKKILIVRASRGRDSFATGLQSAGCEVEQVIAYQHLDVAHFPASVIHAADTGEIDWLTVTSSATAENLRRILGDRMSRLKIASLSPVTSETLRGMGYSVAAEANPSSMQSLVESIIAAENSGPSGKSHS